MDTSFSVESKVQLKQRAQVGSRWLTDRDRKIIQYLCEMKFAGMDDIYERFFKVLADGKESKSKRWAMERVAILEEEGLLKRVRNFQDPQSFFLATAKGYEKCMDAKASYILPKQANSIDVRVFNHDWLVLKLRNLLGLPDFA